MILAVRDLLIDDRAAQNNFNENFQSGRMKAVKTKLQRDVFLAKLDSDVLQHKGAVTDNDIEAAVRKFPILVKAVGSKKLEPGVMGTRLDRFTFTGAGCKYDTAGGQVKLDVTARAQNGVLQKKKSLKEVFDGTINYAQGLKDATLEYFSDERLKLLGALDVFDLWELNASDATDRKAAAEQVAEHFGRPKEAQKRTSTNSIKVEYLYTAAADNHDDFEIFVPNQLHCHGSCPVT